MRHKFGYRTLLATEKKCHLSIEDSRVDGLNNDMCCLFISRTFVGVDEYRISDLYSGVALSKCARLPFFNRFHVYCVCEQGQKSVAVHLLCI